MKRQGLFFFTSLFGSAKTSSDQKTTPLKTESPKEVIITAASQPNVLQKRMQEQKLTHGETVTASLSPVRLEVGHEKMAIFFCPMKTLEVSEIMTPGDGLDIPEKVIVEGLSVPFDFKSGMYSLKHVKLTSNGTMQIKATDKTTWEKVVEPEII